MPDSLLRVECPGLVSVSNGGDMNGEREPTMGREGGFEQNLEEML